MNKKLIAVTVAAGLSLPMAAVHAEPTVYGKLHFNYGNYESAGADAWKFSSFDSRLGVKGEKELNAGLKAVYLIELGINPDTDGKSTDTTTGNSNDGTAGLSRRNMYAGLKGGFGTVLFGRIDSPLKKAQGKFDQFGDTAGDFKHAGDQDGENRNDSTINYKNKFGNIALNVQFAPGEGDGVATGNGPVDKTSLAVAYKGGPLYVAFATDSYDSTGGAAEDSLARLVATYKLGDMQFGALVQSGVEKPTNAANKEDWLGMSFGMKMGANKLKAQYITVEDSAATVQESTQLSLGFDHKLDKKTTVYAMYNQLEETAGATTVTDKSSVSVGYILKF